MTLTYTDRLINGPYLILTTEIRILADKYPHYTYRFVEGEETIRTATQELRSQLTGSVSGSTGTVSGNVLPSYSGHFPGEVIAHTGVIDKEARLDQYFNSASSARRSYWGKRARRRNGTITADSLAGSLPGTVPRLKFHAVIAGSVIECALMLSQSKAPRPITNIMCCLARMRVCIWAGRMGRLERARPTIASLVSKRTN